MKKELCTCEPKPKNGYYCEHNRWITSVARAEQIKKEKESTV